MSTSEFLTRSHMPFSRNAILPILVPLILFLLPIPSGLQPYAWYYFAIFVGVIVGLILEPLPGGAVGLIGVTIITLFAKYVYFSPSELAQTGFNPVEQAITWGLSGFSNTTVWLIFGAFMFALGYEKTGLGKRLALLLVKKMGKKTLTLGYAILSADLILAPFTPSVTARSGGTIYPIIRNLPPLYGSLPNDISSRKIGSYLMWVAIASTCVTSSLFLTALAPNLLAMELVKNLVHVQISWWTWFISFVPVGIILLILIPLVTYWLYPPQIKIGEEVPKWASTQLKMMGRMSLQEIMLGILVIIALIMWIFFEKDISATTAALGVICLMLITRIVSWNDIIQNSSAWNTLVWFATLVALANGLNHVGFIAWLADSVAHHMQGFSPTLAILLFLTLFFFLHYLFASVTAHTVAVLPVMLAIGSTIPHVSVSQLSILLCLTLGIMGIITPYAIGPGPIYYGSGYLPSRDYWRLGLVFGLIYFITFILIGVPWVSFYMR